MNLPLSIDEGPFGHPPKTRRRDYSVVLIQLLWRMRFDLLLLAALSLLVEVHIRIIYCRPYR